VSIQACATRKKLAALIRTKPRLSTSMLIFLAKLFFSLGFTYVAWNVGTMVSPNHGSLGLCFSSVVWGVLFANDIYEIGPKIKYWASWSVFHRWQGCYYTFDGAHLRFFLIDETIWLPVSDLKRVIEPALSERELRLLGDEFGEIPGYKLKGISETGLLHVLSCRTEQRFASHTTIRFRNWLLDNALPNVKRLPRSSANFQ
jgi:hypothetical protein